MWSVIKNNPISTFSVLVVTVLGGFLWQMIWWQTTILTSPDWCRKAQAAERIAPGKTAEQSLESIKSCNEMLLVQLNAVATDSHIDHGIIGIVVIVLVVVVIASARLSFKLSREGIEGDLSRDGPQAAQAVAEAAETKADEISEQAKP